MLCVCVLARESITRKRTLPVIPCLRTHKIAKCVWGCVHVCVWVGVCVRVLHVMHCDPPTYPPATPPPTVSHMIIIHIHCSPTERRKYGKIEERNAHVRETTTHNCRPRVALVLAAGVSRFINVTVHSRIVFLSFRSKVFFLRVQVMFYC